jgi:hypothetical protein
MLNSGANSMRAHFQPNLPQDLRTLSSFQSNHWTKRMLISIVAKLICCLVLCLAHEKMGVGFRASRLLFWLFWVISTALIASIINLHSLSTRIMNKSLLLAPKHGSDTTGEEYIMSAEPIRSESVNQAVLQLLKSYNSGEPRSPSALKHSSRLACIEASTDFLSVGAGAFQPAANLQPDRVTFDARCLTRSTSLAQCVIPWTAIISVMAAMEATISKVVVLQESERRAWAYLALTLLGAHAAHSTVATPPTDGDKSTVFSLPVASPIRALLSPCRSYLQEQVSKGINVPAGSSTNHNVVILASSGTRKILDVDALSKRIAEKVPETAIIAITGSEDLDEIAHVFSSARIVIGLSGPGLGYTLFSPKGSLVVELALVSRTTTPKSTSRSGTESEGSSYLNDSPVDREFGWREIGGIEWQAFFMEDDAVLHQPTFADNTTLEERPSYGRVLNDNGNGNVMLGRQHIDNLVALLQQYMSPAE